MKSLDDHQFDALVAQFYRAATGGQTWPQALAPMAALFAATAAAVHRLPVPDGRPLPLDGEAGRAPSTAWAGPDPATCRDIAAALAAGRAYYGEQPRSAAASGCLLVPPSAPGEPATLLTLEWPVSRGPLSAAQRAGLHRLGGCLHEAVQVHTRLRRQRCADQALPALLELMPHPTWLIEPDRHIVQQNQAARSTPKHSRHLARRGARLVLPHAGHDQRLGAQLQQLAASPPGSLAAVDLRPCRADPPCWLHLARLSPALAAPDEPPWLLATLFRPGQLPAPDPARLVRLLGLTPAEASVAARLTEGKTASAIAADLGKSVCTVRCQIRLLLHKLGASRLVDMVRILVHTQSVWSAASAPPACAAATGPTPPPAIDIASQGV